MIFRVSAQLAKRIHVGTGPARPLNPNPGADWSARVFTSARVPCILLTNTASLFSAVMYAKGINDDSTFLKRAIGLIHETMKDYGHELLWEHVIMPTTASVLFAKALSRSTTGAMNDLAYQASCQMSEGDLAPYDVSRWLNRIPMEALKCERPCDVFPRMLMRAGVPPPAS